MKHIDKPTG